MNGDRYDYVWDEHLGEPTGDPQDSYTRKSSTWNWRMAYKPRWCASKSCQLVAVEAGDTDNTRVYCMRCTGELS